MCADGLIFDYHNSSYSFSNSFIYLQNQLIKIEERFKSEERDVLVGQNFQEILDWRHNFSMALSGSHVAYDALWMGLRTAELVGFWYPMNVITSVLNHELCGHGYRVRSLGADLCKETGYSIDIKMRKGRLGVGGVTKYQFKKPRTFTEDLSITIAGIESNFIFAQNIVMNWLEKGYIEARQASLWRDSQFACSSYIKTLKNWSGGEVFYHGIDSGHDIASYFTWLHTCYGSYATHEEGLEELRIKSRLSIILNPFTYLSYLSELSYILFNSRLPTLGIPINEYQFLPCYRMGLTPFGIEDCYEFYIWKRSLSPICVYGKFGSFSDLEYFGFGIEARKLVAFSFATLGFKLDLWSQPVYANQEINVDVYSPINIIERFSHQYSQRAGGACSIIVQTPSQKNPNANLWFQLGGKTAGYLPGESLYAAPILKLGSSWSF